MTQPIFDDLTDAYEAMIDWPKRLANEEPFYRRLFERFGASRLLDVACGTGRHAAMFRGWNLRVEGADISRGMIERAKASFGESADLRWSVRGFDQPTETEGRFDVALCVGNSLAMAPDFQTVNSAIRQMMAAVRPGGAIVVQVLNLWRLPDGPCVWQKCRRSALPDGEVLIVKGVHRSGSRGYVDFVVVSLSGATQMHTESVPLLGLDTENLSHFAQDAGASRIDFFGGYQDQPYDRQESVDLLMVAEKRAND